ncbi:MAG: hypothetical protein JNK64_09360 [Myxococcales bacterium]|nr:hypothetical protein [Myxococcales bacterium]
MWKRAGVLAAIAATGACAGDDPTPYTITFTGDDHLAYLAAQDGDGAWQRLTLDATGQATFTVTRGYHGLAFACGVGGSTPRFLSAPFDAGPPAAPLAPCGDGRPYATVSGAVNPPDAEIALGLAYPLWHAAGSYEAQVPIGALDAVVMQGTQIAIRRGEPVTGDRTLDLDLTVDSFPLATVTPTVTGAGADPVTLYAEILTANQTYVRHPDASPAALIVPVAQRVAGDRVVIGASRGTAARGQIDQREVFGEALPALAFAPLPALEVDRAGVRFGDGWDFASVAYHASSVGGLRANVITTAAWADASGATVQPLLDVAALPGWDPAWPTLAASTAITLDAWAGIGDLSGDYQTAWVSADATW